MDLINRKNIWHRESQTQYKLVQIGDNLQDSVENKSMKMPLWENPCNVSV